MANINKTILLIEDEESLIEIYQLAFSNAGYKVLVSKTCKSGLRIARQEQPDLIILDLVFFKSDGELSKEPGFTTLKKLKSNKAKATKDIPVIIFTNLSKDEAGRAMELGARDFVLKASTTPKKMIERVGAILKK